MYKQPLLLCVDDSKPALAIRQKVLETRGYQVLTAHNSGEALILFQTFTVDLVIADHLLGGELGTELAALMKQIDPHVPIVLLAGMPPESMRNIDCYIQKGEPTERMLLIIGDLLSRSLHGVG